MSFMFCLSFEQQNMTVLLILAIIFVSTSIKNCYGTHGIITNVTSCGKPMIYLNFDCKMGNDGIQKCNITHRSPVENGENFKSNIIAEMLRNGRWRKILTIKEDQGVCKTLQVYLKKLLYNALELAGQPNKCPIHKGTTFIKELPMNFEDAYAIGIPKVPLRLQVKTYEKATKKLGICVYLEIEP